MRVAICIIAKDEERCIARALAQVSTQSLLRSTCAVEVHVVVNGTSDATVSKAESVRGQIEAAGATLTVHDLQPAGKSRAWNRAVHELLNRKIDTVMFMDADIELSSEAVFQRVVAILADMPEVKASSGFPLKDLSRKVDRSALDSFSLAVSRESRSEGAINGSLYAARMVVLQDIWLPDETPGEDGFLNAMVTTGGFTHPPDPASVRTSETPTHFYKAHDALNFFNHERRMIVGTIINRWIFEHLWALGSRDPIGAIICRWNEEDPQWVEDLIRKRIGGRWWLVPNAILFGRLKQSRGGVMRSLAYLPAGLAASLLTIPPALMANRRLKKMGAAETW